MKAKLFAAWRAARGLVVPAIVLWLIVLALFWRAWTPVEGARRAFAWDAQYEYWGDLQLQADALADGELALWNPHDRLGYPFHADPQAGNLYPVQWALVGAASVMGHTPWWLITAKNLFHLWFGAFGMFVLLRRRGVPATPSMVGALVALTSYAVLHNAPSALDWGFAWIPWWLAAADAWVGKPTWRRGAVLGMVTALAILAGAWASFWYGTLVVVPLTLVGLVTTVRATPVEERRALLRRLGISLGVALGVFVLLAGAQLASTAGLVGDTVRSERGVDFFGTTAFKGVDWAGFFLPRGLGENTYLGWGPILWAVIYVGLRPTARNLTLVGIIILSITLAMGDLGPVLPALASAPSPFDLFRRAHRYLYVLVVPLGLLAGEGLAALAALEDPEKRARLRRGVLRLVAVAAIIFGVAFAVKLEAPAKDDDVRDAFAFALCAVLAAGFTTWLVLRHPKARAVLAVAVVVCGLDLWIARSKKIEAAFQPIPSLKDDKLLAGLDGLPRPFRIYDNERIGYRPGIRLGLRDLGGYEGDPLALQRFDRVLQAVRTSPRRAAHAGIAYIFDGRRKLPGGGPQAAGMQSFAKTSYRVADPAADVLWFDSAAIAADADAAWSQASGAAPGAIAVLEQGQLPAGDAARATQVDAPGSAPVPGRVTRWTLNSLTAEVDAPADGLVVINELWHRRGWTATVDGQAAPIYAVDGFARGVLVGPGHHVIAMSYRATGWVVGGAIALVTWLVLAVIGIDTIRRRRRAAAAR